MQLRRGVWSGSAFVTGQLALVLEEAEAQAQSESNIADPPDGGAGPVRRRVRNHATGSAPDCVR
jgi:hypothetical protein